MYKQLYGHLNKLVSVICALIIFSTPFFTGCTAKVEFANQLPSHKGTTGTFTDQVVIEDAQNFTVSYHGNWKLVNLRFKSEAREIDFDQTLVLKQRGTEVQLPDSLADAWVIDVPVRSVAANEDGEITRLKSLGLIDAIAGMGGGGIYDPELRERWENKQIASIGYSFHAVPEPERLMSSGAELLVLHTYDNSRLDGMEKLRKLGINAIPQFAWAEPSYLAKSEWLKFSALFFNREKEELGLRENSKSQNCEKIAKIPPFGQFEFLTLPKSKKIEI